MANKHFNSLPTFSTSTNINVDRESGILKNVEIAKFGKNKNHSYFSQKFLDDLVEQGNAQTQGVKSRFGHPNMCMNSLGTYLGRYKDFHQKDGKVYANLYLCDTAKETPNGDLYNYVLNMSEKNPDMFGNSIVVDCYSQDEHIVNESGDNEVVESLILEAFISSDVVDDPAATDAMFSNSEDLGVITTQFLDTNPQIIETIAKNPAILNDFFERYATYSLNSKTKIDMSFLDTLKKQFSTKKVFDIDVTLATGDIVTVVTEGEKPAVGDAVKDSEGAAVADGNHKTADGDTIVSLIRQ